MNKVLVCPVAFNENVKLKQVIERYLKSKANRETDYLVVDDASDDGTTEVIAQYASQGVKTIKHNQRRGVGAGIRTAIQYAQKQGYEVLVIMAGNDKDDPEEIPRLVDSIFNDQYDFVQGSRYKNSGGIGGDMPHYRKIATKVHPWLMSLITGRKVTDSTNGFRAFRLSLFKDNRINIDQSWLDQYELEPYILYKAITLGFRFTEVPVTKIYPSRKLGYTKMRPLIGWWSILRPLVYLGLGIKK
jgi:dolichol-phosphate mannosyltransferase